MCRLFACGTPVLRTLFSAREQEAISELGTALKPSITDQRYALCPYCQQHRGQVFSGSDCTWMCHCPGCGPVALTAEDTAAFALDETWLQESLRCALHIRQSGSTQSLSQGVWLLGQAHNAPVLLIRDLMLLWREPTLLDRVRVPGGNIRVISPKSWETRGEPFARGVAWLPLEERFEFAKPGIHFIEPHDDSLANFPVNPTAPVHGPFSADFKWITLTDWPYGLIRCTPGQAAVFAALWSCKGRPMAAEQIMDRCGLDSDKLVDLFKVKARDKGKPEIEGARFAYERLVMCEKRRGLYTMACAAQYAT